MENHSQLGIGKWASFAQLKHFLENKGDLSVDQIIRIFNFYLNKIGITEEITDELNDIAKAVTIVEQKNEQLRIGSDLLVKSKNDKIALWGMGASLVPGFVYIAAIVGTNNSVEDINKKSIEIKITQSIGQLDLEKMETTILQNAQRSIIEQADYSVIRENLEFLARVCNDKAQRKLIIKILASLNKLQPKENTNKINDLLKESLSETTSEIKAILEGSVSQKFVGQAKNSAEVIQSGIKPLAQQIGNLCRHLPFGQKEKIEKLSPENKAKAMVATRAFTMFAVRVAAPIAIANREALGNLAGGVWKNVSESVGGQPVFTQPVGVPKGNFFDNIAERFIPEAPKYGVEHTTLYQALAQNPNNTAAGIKSYLSVNGLNPNNNELVQKIFNTLNNNQIAGIERVNPEFLESPQNLKKAMAEIIKIPELQTKTGLIDGIKQFLDGKTPQSWDKVPTNLTNLTKAGQEVVKQNKERIGKISWLATSIIAGAIVNPLIGLLAKKKNGRDQFTSKRNVVGIGASALAGAVGGFGGVVAMTGVAIGGQVIGSNIKRVPKFIEKIGRPMMESAQEKLAELQSRGEINIKTEEQKIVQFETKIAKIKDGTRRTELLAQKENLEDFLIELEHTQKGFISEDKQLIKQIRLRK